MLLRVCDYLDAGLRLPVRIKKIHGKRYIRVSTVYMYSGLERGEDEPVVVDAIVLRDKRTSLKTFF